MNLDRVKLDRFRIDSEGFLGQAIELGMKFKKLPDHMPEILLAFLRMAGAQFAQRYRAGISISGEGLARGVRRAAVSLELGLKDAAEGNLDTAADLLAGGDFERFRKRGAEIGFFRVQEMGEACRAFLDLSEHVLFRNRRKDLQRWAAGVPETWTAPPEEDEEEVRQIDPILDYEEFQVLKGRFEFVRALPGSALSAFLDAAEEPLFEDLLRNLLPGLALDLETLVLATDEVKAFELCFDAGQMRAEVKEKVTGMVDVQLQKFVSSEVAREKIAEELAEQIVMLEAASTGALEGFFVTVD